MELIGRHPLNHRICSGHIGRPVYAEMLDGRFAYGIMDRVDGEYLHLRPLDGFVPPQVRSMSKKSTPDYKARTSLFFPFLFTIPLLAIASLFAFPFFWW